MVKLVLFYGCMGWKVYRTECDCAVQGQFYCNSLQTCVQGNMLVCDIVVHNDRNSTLSFLTFRKDFIIYRMIFERC